MASCDLAAWAARIVDNVGTGIATTGQVYAWLQYNPFRLNAAFGTAYGLSGACLDPTLTTNHSGVYEEMYYCNLFNKLAIQNLGVAGFDIISSTMEGQGSMKFVSRNDKSKTYRDEAKACNERLQKLIDDLSVNAENQVLVAQILFSDRTHMLQGDSYCPPCDYWTNGNTVFSKFYTYS